MPSFPSSTFPTMIARSTASQALCDRLRAMQELRPVGLLWERDEQPSCEVLHSSCALPSDFSSIFDAVDDRARPTCDSFTTSERTKTLGSTAFHTDRRIRCAREPVLHLCTMWCELRRLADHAAIDVSDHPSLSANHPGYLFEDANRISALPSIVSVGKMFTDVTETGSAEQGVGTCVSDDIGVTVTDQAKRTFEDDTAENEDARRIVGEAMDVESLTDSNVGDVL
jgi:hypothetical protein